MSNNQTICPRCQKANNCAMTQPDKAPETCWCMQSPKGLSTPESQDIDDASCYCPQCLEELHEQSAKN